MTELSSLSENITTLLKLDESIKNLSNEQKELKKQRDLIDIQGRFEVITLCQDNPIHPGVDSVLMKRIQ